MSTEFQIYTYNSHYFDNNKKNKEVTIYIDKILTDIRKSDLSNENATKLSVALLNLMPSKKVQRKNRNIISWLKWLIGIIVSLGGLWGLLNFILNLSNKFSK